MKKILNHTVILCLSMTSLILAEMSPIDLKDRYLTTRSKHCADFINDFEYSVKDIKRNKVFLGKVSILSKKNKCIIQVNAIPNYDFNDNSAEFKHPVAAIDRTLEIPKNPKLSKKITPLSLKTDNAIFLNGIKLDRLAAACYGVGRGRLGEEKIGCFDPNQPFRYDPMSPLNAFGTDSHNAHVQRSGEYHYHGDPNALYKEDRTQESPVIGFAADGFPIYGPYIQDAQTNSIRKVRSSYQLKSGKRSKILYQGQLFDPNHTFTEDHNGRFEDDWEYVVNLGDLDECNGMYHNGSYGYYVTETFPWVLNCFKGKPDKSFDKKPQKNRRTK